MPYVSSSLGPFLNNDGLIVIIRLYAMFIENEIRGVPTDMNDVVKSLAYPLSDVDCSLPYTALSKYNYLNSLSLDWIRKHPGKV